MSTHSIHVVRFYEEISKITSELSSNMHLISTSDLSQTQQKLNLQTRHNGYMSRIVRKPAFRICENKDADQLRSNREANQRLCFCYTDSTIPLLSNSEISNL